MGQVQLRRELNGLEQIVLDIRTYFMQNEERKYVPEKVVLAKRGFTKYWLKDIGGFYQMAFRHRYYLNNPATDYLPNKANLEQYEQ